MRCKTIAISALTSLIAASCLALAAPGAALAALYTFDKAHTNVTFSWNRLGLSRQSGRVLDVDGIVDFEPEAPEQGQVDVSLRVASIWTGVPALDKHLRSPDFFDAERHPLITFRSTSARRTGQTTGEVTGELTILGVSRPLTLHVNWNFTGEHPFGKFNANYAGKIVSGFTATARLRRSDWGMTRAIPLASDEIEITINTELLRK